MHVCWRPARVRTRTISNCEQSSMCYCEAAQTPSPWQPPTGGMPNAWQVWRDVEPPSHKVVVPGVIDSTTNLVEHPETVAERVHPDVVWAKPRSLVQG
jgi:methionine synthase II (cobalamin-independent)